MELFLPSDSPYVENKTEVVIVVRNRVASDDYYAIPWGEEEAYHMIVFSDWKIKINRATEDAALRQITC